MNRKLKNVHSKQTGLKKHQYFICGSNLMNSFTPRRSFWNLHYSNGRSVLSYTNTTGYCLPSRGDYLPS